MEREVQLREAYVKHTVNKNDIALMQDGKGWWLKVGKDWHCIINSAGVCPDKSRLLSSQDDYAANKARFYKPLVDILKEVPIVSSRSS